MIRIVFLYWVGRGGIVYYNKEPEETVLVMI